MKLSGREDVDGSVEAVFDLLTDFDLFERAALRRGVEVTPGQENGQRAWALAFQYKGRQRRIRFLLERMERPLQLVFAGTSRPVDVGMTIDLVPLGSGRTRMTIGTEIRPRTLAARLFLQSLKLARAQVDRRYKKRIGQFATMLEARLRGEGGGL